MMLDLGGIFTLKPSSKSKTAHVRVSPDRGFRGGWTSPKYEMIQDESQLEIPQYIDEPKYVQQRSAGYGLFFLGWLVWICCSAAAYIAAVVVWRL